MVLFLLFSLTTMFVFGQNEEIAQIFNDAKKIDDDIVDTPVCIKVIENGEEEFLYTADFMSEKSLLANGTVWPYSWLAKQYLGLSDAMDPRYVFFTHPFILNLPWPLNLSKEYKWKLKPLLDSGWDTFEIENYARKQVLHVMEEQTREKDLNQYVFIRRKFVFSDNIDGYDNDLSRTWTWKIRKVKNAGYLIRNAWSNEFLYRARLQLENLPIVSALDQKEVGNLAATWINLIEDTFVQIEEC